METIAPPVAELLAQLHDNATGVIKLIEAIPALKGDDLPQIVNRVHMLGKLAELEKPFDGYLPTDKWLRTRVRLLQALRQAQYDEPVSYEIRSMSNKQIAMRTELLRRIEADQLNNWKDVEIDDAIAKLHRERRRRARDAKAAQTEAAKPNAQEEEEIEEDDEVEGLTLTT